MRSPGFQTLRMIRSVSAFTISCGSVARLTGLISVAVSSLDGFCPRPTIVRLRSQPRRWRSAIRPGRRRRAIRRLRALAITPRHSEPAPRPPSRQVTSKVLCQGEKGWDSLHFVFVGEDGEEDAVHGGSHGLAFGEGLVAKAGQKLIEIVAQTGDGGRIGLAPALGEAAGGRARLHRRVGVHDGVQVDFEGRLVGYSDFVEDVADLVRPAALDGDFVVYH